MAGILIGHSLDVVSELPLEVGLGIAKTLKEKALVIHSEFLTDTETIKVITTNLNVNIEQNYIQALLQKNKDSLKQKIEKITPIDDSIEYKSLSGDPVSVIMKQAKENDISLVVLGSQGEQTLLSRIVGGVTDDIFHQLNKSVLIVKNRKAKSPKKILVPYDFSKGCLEGVKWAKKFKENNHIEVHLINVLPCYYEGYHVAHIHSNGLNSAMEEVIDENLKKVEEDLASDVEKNFGETTNLTSKVLLDKEGSISEVLNKYAKKNEIDLIVMGSHKKSRLSEFFLGSVSQKIIRNSDVSVLIAK